MYRVLQPLDAGSQRGRIEVGSITTLDWLPLKARQKLVLVGAVSEVAPPPLNVLPGWKMRSGKLARHGVVDAVQLMRANSVELAERLGYKPRTIERWKEEVRRYVTIEAPPRVGG